MKKWVFYTLMLSIVSCGVPRSEHFALKIEKEKLQNDYDYLQEKYDKLKSESTTKTRKKTPIPVKKTIPQPKKSMAEMESTAERTPEELAAKGSSSNTKNAALKLPVTKMRDGVKIELTECVQKGTALACYFNYTSNEDEKVVSIYKHFTGKVYAKIIDMEGNEYGSLAAKIGKNSTSNTLMKDVMVKGYYRFSSVKRPVEQIRLMKIQMSEDKSDYLKYENIPVRQVQ